MFHQQPEQINFLGHDVDFPGTVAGGVAGEIDGHIAKGYGLGQRCLTTSAQESGDPFPQQHHGKGLCHVVVCLFIKTHNLGILVLNGCKHQDGGCACPPYLVQNRQTADMGQHNVQHNKVDAVLTEKLKGLAAIIGRDD